MCLPLPLMLCVHARTCVCGSMRHLDCRHLFAGGVASPWQQGGRSPARRTQHANPPVPVRTARHVADVGARCDSDAEAVEIAHAEDSGRKQSGSFASGGGGSVVSVPHTGRTMLVPKVVAACAEKKETNQTTAQGSGSTLCTTPTHDRQYVAASALVAQGEETRGNALVTESEMYITPFLALTSSPHQGHAFEDDLPLKSSALPGSSPYTSCTCACSPSLLHDMIQVHVSMYMHAGECLCAHRCLDCGKQSRCSSPRVSCQWSQRYEVLCLTSASSSYAHRAAGAQPAHGSGRARKGPPLAPQPCP